jgi:hypothetical protein
VFLSCRPFFVNTFSTVLVGAEVSSAQVRRQKKLQHFQDMLKMCINNERPAGKKHTSAGWFDGEK